MTNYEYPHIYTCQLCGGSGEKSYWRVCANCSGSGQIANPQLCETTEEWCCGQCDGYGGHEELETCPDCEGSGKVQRGGYGNYTWQKPADEDEEVCGH